MNKKLVSNSNFVLRKVLNNGDCLGVLKDFIESILETKIDEYYRYNKTIYGFLSLI